MGSRRIGGGVENVYAAAEKWVDCALRTDDSLFTPGTPIWSSQWLGELRRRFLDRPDEGSGTFYEKLQVQLEDSPLEVYQLMGEVLYVHFLIVWHRAMAREVKENQIRNVLGWSTQQVTIPDDLVVGLAPGMVDGRPGFNMLRPFLVGFIIEFVEQWKEQQSGKRDLLIHDQWAFKEFLDGLDFRSELLRDRPNSPGAQREALLHLVFPDTFEAILGGAKKSIAEAHAFSHFVTESTVDADRKLVQIRSGLEAEIERDFDFYDPDIRKHWDSTFDPDNEHVACELPDMDRLHALAVALNFKDISFLQEIELLLEDKLQVIFQGPPGTGKTYVAQKLANHLAGSEDRVTLVQFHPSYAYEDFVQGFRPTILDNGQAGFKLTDGPLRKAADRAREDPEAKHFLVIDEINRGNLARILGELYFLLEYRDNEMDLQYSDEPFSLPDNLYIIGTMNTADRSIALVDLALRRRFYFVEFHPDDDPVKGVLRNWLRAKVPNMEWVANVVDAANEKLSDDRHAAIGPSYFMKPDLDESDVKRIWKHSVLPYIEERLFGNDDRVSEFDLDKLRGTNTRDSQTDNNADGEPNDEAAE